MTALGGQVLVGARAVAEAGIALGDANPLSHHVTNVVVTGTDGDQAQTRSKGLSVDSDGRVGSVVYADELRRTTDGWRLPARQGPAPHEAAPPFRCVS